jgi:COP9 signalosome complex subunit 6
MWALPASSPWWQNSWRLYADANIVIGALLGSQANREVSIINSFELTYVGQNGQTSGAGDDGDVQMDTGTIAEKGKLDAEFLENRKDQCEFVAVEEGELADWEVVKQVFPTLEVVGWYSVGEDVSEEDVKLHEQVGDTCIMK